MAEMPPEQTPPPQGGGSPGILRQRYLGIPGVVWLAGAAFLAYFLFFRGKGSSGAGGTSTGGGGQSTTGDITLTPGTTTLDLTGANPAPINTTTGSVSTDQDNGGLNPGQPGQSGTPNPQPSPVPPGKTVGHHTSVTYTNYTVQKGENLLEIAKKFGISRATLAHVNRLGTGAGLRTGQVLKIPHVRTTTS